MAAAAETGALELARRQLPLFPDQLTDLAFVTSLDLSYNRIDRLPPSLSSMHGLRACVLAGNSIDRLPSRVSAPAPPATATTALPCSPSLQASPALVPSSSGRWWGGAVSRR